MAGEGEERAAASDDGAWETHAGWWQEYFTDGADPEYEEQILPLVDVHLAGKRRVLDVGCGEGQLARRVAALGAEVLGIDPTQAQIVEARALGAAALDTPGARPPDSRYARESVDAVVACLVLEHVDPFEPAIDEVARVLVPGGHFVLFLNHPLLQAPGSGWVDDQILGEEYWRVGPYLPDDHSIEEVAPGVRLPFMHRPLSRYINVMAERGLLADHMDEPPPAPGFVARAPEYGAAATIPRLLVLRTRKAPVTAVAPVTTPARPPEPHPARPAVVLGAMVLLLAVYALLSFANDPRGTLGTDTGGKLATLAEMEQTKSLDPDIGYWAEDHDPEGRLHPLWYTSHIGDRWVNVTTLPMLVAASPLYDVGGPRAVLLLPMLGAAFAALAARALSRRIAGGDGWWAFWVVGLASPIAIYALDFWEHALGVAFVLWAVVFMFDLLDGRAGWRGALAAGLLFGAAATMRTEALVYAAAAVGVTAIVLLHRTIVRRDQTWMRNFQFGFAWLAGIGSVLVANQLLERAVLGNAIRADRAAGTAGMAGEATSLRVQEGLTTAVGVNRYDLHMSWFLGALAVAFVAYAAWRFAAPRRADLRIGALALGAAFLLYFVRIADGLDFIPGFLSASPLAAAGLAVGWSVRRWRTVGALALLALPVVWVFQFSGGAGPQWGGRYLLVTSTLLVVGAAVVLPAMPKAARIALVVLAVLVTASGLAWLSQRSHTVADAMTAIQSGDGTVLVSREQHVLREGGAFYRADERWLTATTPGDLDRTAEIASDIGAPALRVVSIEGREIPATIGEWQRADRSRVEFVPGLYLNVVTYTRDGAVR